MPGHGPALDRFTAGAADAAEQVHQQRPISQLPDRWRNPIRDQGRALQTAALQRPPPAVVAHVGESRPRALHHLIRAELQQGVGQQCLHGEHPIAGRSALDQPALRVQWRGSQARRIEQAPPVAIRRQHRDADRLQLTVEAAGLTAVVPYLPKALASRGPNDRDQALPSASDLNRRARDAQRLCLQAHALDDHTLQRHREVVAAASTGQRLQRPDAPSIQTGGHFVALRHRLTGFLAKLNRGSDGLHQPIHLRAIRPLEAQSLADQALTISRGLLQLDPHPVLLRSLWRCCVLRCRQDQPADPFRTGAVEIRAGLLLQRVALRPAPDRAAGEDLTALGQRLSWRPNRCWRNGGRSSEGGNHGLQQTQSEDDSQQPARESAEDPSMPLRCQQAPRTELWCGRYLEAALQTTHGSGLLTPAPPPCAPVASGLRLEGG